MEKTGPKVGESSMLPGLSKVSHLASVCLGQDAWGQAGWTGGCWTQMDTDGLPALSHVHSKYPGAGHFVLWP